MSETPVRRLIVKDPDLKDPVAVKLGDFLPASARTELDRLDRDDSGELVYCPDSRYALADPSCELTRTDRSADTFTRLFWAFEGDSPHNDFKKDQDTYPARRGEALRIQEEIYGKVIRPLLSDPKNPARYDKAREILILLADPAGLFRVFHDELLPQWRKTGDPKFLFLGERYLLEAKRLASATRWGRSDDFLLIDTWHRHLNFLLEPIEDQKFREAIKNPYLVIGFGAPVTIDQEKLDQANRIDLLVSVPTGSDRKKIIGMLNAENPRLKPSVFKGTQGTEEFSLEAKEIIPENKIDPLSSSFIREERLDEILFGEKRDYVYISFAFKNPKDREKVLGGRETRKFDLLTKISNFPGSVVIQNKKGKEINIIFASDLHITDRDYETRKILIDSLALERNQSNQNAGERIERFYEPFNENVEAAVEDWNEQYRTGKLDKVILAGDLVDFINIAATSKDQGFRGTNFSRLHHILSKIEPPVYLKPGNHDLHIRPYPRSLHKQGFPDDPELYAYYEDHYDAYRFQGSLYLEGIKSLLTRRIDESEGELDFITKALEELLSDKPYARPNDEGLRHYYRYFEAHEADVIPLGNGRDTLFHAKTNEEDFNEQPWAFEQLNEPVVLNLLDSFHLYLFSQLVWGKGERPEIFQYFVDTAARLRERGGRLTYAAHYPSLYNGVGSDQTPDAEDTLRGEVNWLHRLANDHYRFPSGNPVVNLSVAGHVHHPGKYDLHFDFHDKEEKGRFKADVDSLFDNFEIHQIPTDKIYRQADPIRKKYALDQHIITDRYLNPQSDFAEFNHDSEGFGRSKGTMYLNLPALGPSSATNPPGYLKLTINPDGRETLSSTFFFVEKDGTILKDQGENLPSLKKRHRDRIRDWKISHGDKPTVPEDEPLPPVKSPEEQREEGFAGPPLFDPAPFLCQYPKGKICWGVGVGITHSFDFHDFSGPDHSTDFEITPVRLTLPLSNRHHPVFGLNYLRTGLTWSTQSDSWRLSGSLGLGIWEPHLFAGLDFADPKNIYGGGLLFGNASAMIIPAPDLFFYVTQDLKDWGIGLGLHWNWEVLSVHLRRHRHSH